MNFKSEVHMKFKEWKALREMESGKQVTRFRTDGGSQYTSKKFAEYLKSGGISKEMRMPYTRQCNGVVEQGNCTIMERVGCMLDNAGLLKKLKAFAVPVAVYLKNHTPQQSVVGKTPYEVCGGSANNTSFKHLCVFGY